MTDYAFRRAGASHTAKRIGCQDNTLAADIGSGRSVLALSDGHSCALRAAMASRIACLAFRLAAADGCGLDELPARVKDHYDRLIAKHKVLRPVSEAERALLAAKPDLILYGATLLGVILEPSAVTLFRLGDGSVSLLRGDGSLFPALPQDPDCLLAFTSSLSYPREEAIRHSRCVRFPEPAAAVLLLSDGYRYSGSAPRSLLAALWSPETVPETYPKLLELGENGDDQSVVLSRDDAAVSSAKFREGLDRLLREGVREEKLRRLEREKQELSAYLRIALSRGSEMAKRGDREGRERLLAAARPRAQRYKELLSELERLLKEDENHADAV